MECRPLGGLVHSLVPILILLLCPAISTAQTPRLKNIALCNGEDRSAPDLQINGCTALIDAGDETPLTVAIAYNNRGNAYVEKGEYDLAIKDLDQAIKLTPESGQGVQ